MTALLGRYARWLHLAWPAGRVEPLPDVDAEGRCSVPGVRIAGDLTGIPLLKFALDTGARAVASLLREASFGRTEGTSDGSAERPYDLVVIGGGVSGVSAAVEAKKAGLQFAVLESARPLSTLLNFPARKPIFTYPTAMVPAGSLRVSATVKEALVEELSAQLDAAALPIVHGRAASIRRTGGLLTIELAAGSGPTPYVHARRVVVAIGRSGDYRRLGVPGENLSGVLNRLHDPKEGAGRSVVVVGGGDSACEAVVALAAAGASVTLVHRADELSRARAENRASVERLAAARRIAFLPGTRVREIRAEAVVVQRSDGAEEIVPRDLVYLFLGRAAPLDFFRRSGIALVGERGPKRLIVAALLLAVAAAFVNWKSGGVLSDWAYRAGAFPTQLAASAPDPETVLGTLAISASGPSFWYTLAYSLAVTLFGIARIRRRKTPYVTLQTLTLTAVQVLPLFLLPELFLPLLHHNGVLPASIAEPLFPAVAWGHGREFWRAYGLILAWPLNVYNFQTQAPLPAWIAIGFVQTFVLIPFLVIRYGKGAYCGWICSCGALAETMGDTLRGRMPHGPAWNRLNLAGQVLLGLAFVLLVIRIVSWVLPGDGTLAAGLAVALEGTSEGRFGWLLRWLNWKWTVDVLLGGMLGLGLYTWASGRVWCRFFCPLSALMHIYARFSRFRIFPEKAKCISCNACTSACHQGIDVMSFANRGKPMEDPECVRCSACVQVCPTGTLAFGTAKSDGTLLHLDRWEASPVRISDAGLLK